MGFWENIVTFGQHERVETARQEYESSLQWYETYRAEVEERNIALRQALEELAMAKSEGVAALKEMRELCDQFSVRDRDYEFLSEEFVDSQTFEDIDTTIDGFDAVFNAANGVGAGVGTGLAAWAAVGAMGTASTGTAITALSGAAASNATLAYLGGGAISAGGGGIAAGTMVLGGLVALPALAISFLLNVRSADKTINEIRGAQLTIRKAREELYQWDTVIVASTLRAKEIEAAVIQTTKGFRYILKQVRHQIRPNPLWAIIRRLFAPWRGAGITQKKVAALHELAMHGQALSRVIDAQVFSDFDDED